MAFRVFSAGLVVICFQISIFAPLGTAKEQGLSVRGLL